MSPLLTFNLKVGFTFSVLSPSACFNSKSNIRDNMTMKKISPTKSWKNVTTCRSSQKPISTTNSLPVICSCATTGLMTGLYSGRLKRPFERG